jgi:hypothetical protein
MQRVVTGRARSRFSSISPPHPSHTPNVADLDPLQGDR